MKPYIAPKCEAEGHDYVTRRVPERMLPYQVSCRNCGSWFDALYPRGDVVIYSDVSDVPVEIGESLKRDKDSVGEDE